LAAAAQDAQLGREASPVPTVSLSALGWSPVIRWVTGTEALAAHSWRFRAC